MKTLSLNQLTKGNYCTFAHHRILEDQPRALHAHDFHELFWVEEGEGWHFINGQKRHLEAGQMVLIHATDKHWFRGDRELHIVNFAFFAEIWTHFHHRYYPGKRIFFSAPHLKEREFILDAKILSEIRLMAEALGNGKRNRLVAERFLIDVLGILENSLTTRKKTVPPWISTVCDAVRRDPPFEEGVLGIARIAGKCPEHLAREFRRYLGQSPTEFLNEERMAYAARRLIATDQEIVNISLDCGLQNLGHFYKLFRLKFGQTPRVFRQRQRCGILPHA